MRLAFLGACGLGLATGWNTANTGAVAERLAGSYGVGLAVVGLFTTALFLTHLLMQIPSGRASDRFGARRTGLAGLAVLAAANAVALAAPDAALALAARALCGVGTALSFVSGSAYVRETGGSPLAQGLYGGVGIAGGGLALAVVPQLDPSLGWRAPYWTALALALASFAPLAAGPADGLRPSRVLEEGVSAALFRDVRLYRLAALYAASFGFSIVLGNWVVTLLDRNSDVGEEAAGAIGALTLLLGVVTRPLGGWILRTHPHRARAAVAASVAAGALGTAALTAAEPLPLAALGAAALGLAAGIPFSAAFTGAAATRPDAPAAAVGFVNGASSLVALAGTPLLGLAFSLPGEGRIGFAAVAVLWLLALAVLPSERELGATGAPGSR